MYRELNLDTFGKMMDEFIEKNEIRMLITMPEGSIEAEIEDNCGNASVLQFYIVLNVIESIAKKMREDMGNIDAYKWAQVVDSLTDLIKKDLCEEAAE